MNTINNTALITGGSAGIGFEIAKLFLATGNTVIITGRDEDRLKAALAQLPGAAGFVSDVSKKEDADLLVNKLLSNYPDLNVVVNNAGRAILYDIANSDNAFENASDEMLTNYLSVIRLNEKLLPGFKTKQAAAIVNVSSVVAFVPGTLPTYSASKAALHSYTQSLRSALANSPVKVFELMPPLVDTELSSIINGKNGIAPSVVAESLLEAIEKDEYEIRVGKTQYIYDLYRQSPAEAIQLMNPAKINQAI